MVIFHSYVSLPEGYLVIRDPKETRKIDEEWFTVGVLLGRSFMFVYFSWSAIGCFGVASSWSICGNLLKVAMCGRTIGSTYASWLLPFGSLEIVDLPIKYGDFHSFFVCLPKGNVRRYSHLLLRADIHLFSCWNQPGNQTSPAINPQTSPTQPGDSFNQFPSI